MTKYEIVNIETGDVFGPVGSRLEAAKWIDKRVELSGHDPSIYRVDEV